MENSLQLMICVGRGPHGGKLEPSSRDKQDIGVFLHRFIGGRVSVTFAPPVKPRSSKQNRYLWGVVYCHIANHTGLNAEEIHEWCKQAFLPRQFVTIAGREREVPKSTTGMTTQEMEQYLERIRAFAAQELRLGIPLPNE